MGNDEKTGEKTKKKKRRKKKGSSRSRRKERTQLNVREKQATLVQAYVREETDRESEREEREERLRGGHERRCILD